MNDRIAGISYDNPIWYKGYRIYISDHERYSGYAYDFVHDNFDGAPDAGDNRCGNAKSIEDAKSQIDDRDK